MAKRDAAAAGVSGGSPEKLIASLASRRLGARQAGSGAAAPSASGEKSKPSVRVNVDSIKIVAANAVP